MDAVIALKNIVSSDISYDILTHWCSCSSNITVSLMGMGSIPAGKS